MSGFRVLDSRNMTRRVFCYIHVVGCLSTRSFVSVNWWFFSFLRIGIGDRKMGPRHA